MHISALALSQTSSFNVFLRLIQIGVFFNEFLAANFEHMMNDILSNAIFSMNDILSIYPLLTPIASMQCGET